MPVQDASPPNAGSVYASPEFRLDDVNQSNALGAEDSYEVGCWSVDEHNAKLLDAVAPPPPGPVLSDVPLHY